MQIGAKERRRSDRAAAACQAILRDLQGRVLLCGRISNLSESGAFLLAKVTLGPDLPGEALLELDVPGERGIPGLMLAYRCRVVRVRQAEGLVGIGLEFIERIGTRSRS